MKVMSAVEHKINGTFIKDGQLVMQERVFGDGDDWEVETIPLENDEFSYALGSGGAAEEVRGRVRQHPRYAAASLRWAIGSTGAAQPLPQMAAQADDDAYDRRDARRRDRR